MSVPSHIPRSIFAHILLSLFLFAPGTPAADVADLLDKGANITDGSTLVSAGKSFTLGFFSPAGVATTKRYLGIWFSVSADTVYWVANRERPLNDTSGVLVMSNTGSLVLLDGAGVSVWSSGSTSVPSAGARLLESGNLVVLGEAGTGTAYLWQSFDHPCNTLLPGMKIGKNLWTGAEWYLSSWRSAADPATGNFRYMTHVVGGLPENMVLDGNNTKRYRTGPWNGQRFNGVPEMSSFADMFTFQLTESPGEVTYGYIAKAGAPYSRVTVTEAGVVQRLVWEGSSRGWKTFFQAPRDICDGYAKCGAFGKCDINNGSTSLCSCVKGFSPRSQTQWSLREYSGGCQRNVELDCSNRSRTTTDGFEVLRGVKLPDTQDASVDAVMSLDQCRARCLANCSCVAYAADLRGGGCIRWMDSFVDLRLIDDGQDFYLRLSNSDIAVVQGPDPGPEKPDKPPVPRAVLVALCAEGVLIVILVVAVILLWLRLSRRPAILTRHPGLVLPLIDYQIIKEGTKDFTAQLGEGNYGKVYECELHEPDSSRIGKEGRVKVAVKVLKQSNINSYATELNMMSRLCHVYLVPLLAYCNHERAGERVLIMIQEYMQNGSLHQYIFGDKAKRSLLSWTDRLNIITSTAKGILYLHVECGKKIIHRDIKPANILLDENWTPKIADFGLAKHVTDPKALHTPIGPFGYLAPECYYGETSDKSDVYSFGVLLLEIISGKVNGLMQELLPHVWNSSVQDLLDPEVHLSQEEDNPEFISRLERCIWIGLLCVQKLPEDRPCIADVADMLRGHGSLQKPEPPTLREKGESSNTGDTNGCA